MKIDYKPLQNFFKKYGNQLTDNQIDAICKLYAQSIIMNNRPIPDFSKFVDQFPKKSHKKYIWNLMDLNKKEDGS